MKIGYRDIEPFVKSPNPAVRVILVYGPDNGLMRERARIMGKTITPDLSDPFQVASLTPDILSDDPSRLNDEANAMSMMGGKRLIRIENASDKVTMALKDYLENPNDNALIIAEADGLSPRSSLRKLCESAKNAAAIPCYVEDERDLNRFISQTLRDNNIRAESDAIAWLSVNIAGDRQKVRAELDKLIIYKHNDTDPLSLYNAKACCGQAGDISLDDLVNSIAIGQTDKALTHYQSLLSDGVSFIVITRSLQGHFKKLHLTRSHMQNGDNIDSAMKKLYPPVFFKQQAQFKAQIGKWPLGKINHALKKCMELEAECKKTGNTPETLCGQAILALSAAA